MIALDNIDALIDKQPNYREIGYVDEVIGLVIESNGPKARIGDVCLIYPDVINPAPIPAEVVGFHSGKLQLMPYGEMTSVSPGSRVINTEQPFTVSVGDALIGRVIDGLGNPLDGRPLPYLETAMPVTAQAPSPLERRVIDEVLPLGVRAIDGFTTVGKGQRLGIFAGSGVGKSTLMGMIARNTDADLNVIALVGERGREVREFIEQILGTEGMKRSIVVVATSEQSALSKIKAGLVATTVAEYFRDQGKNVLLMMDSLTRIAMALREVGLSIGEPPTSRGYTPSMFSFMPKLLERSGTSDTGSITGLYTVLVEGDDLNEPVSDTVRGLLDGHIVLSRDLAHRNHFPAIDVLGSISRLMTNIATNEHKDAAGCVRNALAVYAQNEDIINIGAYVRGSNMKLDQAVALKEAIDLFLQQDMGDKFSFDDTEQSLIQLGNALRY